MNDLIPWLIGLAVLVAVVGALRFDALRWLWAQWLRLSARPSMQPPTGQPVQNPAPSPSIQEAQAHKPDFHRSGRRH